MATYYASVLGSDSNDGKSRAKAKRTINRAMALATAKNDEVIVMDDRVVGQPEARFGPEVSPSSDGVNVNGGVTIRFEPKAVLDQGNQYKHALLAGGKKRGCRVLGANVRNTIGGGIVMTGANYEVAYCDIRNTGSHAISCNADSDGVYVHHNYCEFNDLTENARSGINIYEAAKQDDVELIDFPLPAGLSSYTGKWGMVFYANVVVATGYQGKANADGNAYIYDVNFDSLGRKNGGQAVNPTFYDRHVLYYQNIGVLAFGCGHKIMMSKNCHVICNTMVGNKRSTYVKPGGQPIENQWKGEFANYYSGSNEHVANVALAFNTAGGVFCMAKDSGMGNKNIHFVDNNKYNRNMFWNTTSGKIFKVFGSSPTPSTASASANGDGGYILADPKLVGPWGHKAGDVPLQGGLEYWTTRCALTASSPARGAGPGGVDLGAVPYSTTPPPTPVLTKDADPVLEILGTPMDNSVPSNPVYAVGSSARFKAGTYRNGPPDSVTYTAEWWNGSAYEQKTATITGPTSGWYLFTVPAVAKKGGLQVKAVAVKGTTTVTTTSNWIDVAPAPVVTQTKPANTALPVISPSAAVVGSEATCSTGSWSGSPAPTFGFQWKAGGTNITGATRAAYTPVASDKGKALTCAVTASNAAGSTTATTAATSTVTDPSDLTLAQVVLRLIAAEAAIRTLTANDEAQTERDNGQDKSIEDVETALGHRIGTLETDTGGIPELVDELNTKVQNLQSDLDDLSSSGLVLYDLQDQVSGLERIVVRFTTTGKLRLFPAPVTPPAE